MPSKKSKENKSDFISIIYNQNNDSPKYFELKKAKLLLFVIGLPTITLIALILGVIGLIHTSPFHLVETYQQSSRAREAIARTNALIGQVQKSEEEKETLKKKLESTEAALLQAQTKDQEKEKVEEKVPEPKGNNCPKPVACNGVATGSGGAIGLSTLSMFKPIQGQKDKTRPATLNLSGFKVNMTRDTANLQFNIIPALGGEGKLAGHIIVVMKNELAIQVYPQNALAGNDTQINYSTGEPFSTQRFRPVEAIFLRPRKAGNYTFTIYIFAKNGDLLHYQSVVLPVRF